MQTGIDDSRFNIIASSYEYAIAAFPEARKDADWLMKTLNIQDGEIILEISAGTGFLTEKIVHENPNGLVYAQDIAPKTLDINRQKSGYHKSIIYTTDLNTISDASCDKAVSLGGWHHMEDQISITKATMSKLKNGGYFCVGDFVDDSSIQRYFDEVVDNITVTGHQGLFASKSRMINIGRFAQASKTEVEIIDVPFNFNTEDEIGEFFQKVFALDITPMDTYESINRYFEIKTGTKQLSVMVPYIYAKFTK